MCKTHNKVGVALKYVKCFLFQSDVEKCIMFTYLKKLTVHVHKLSENKIPHSSIFQVGQNYSQKIFNNKDF